MSKLRIVLADDHETVREGLKMIVNAQDDMEVVGFAGDGHEAVARAQELLPDVLVMDISMPRLNGMQAAERVRSLHLPTQIVMLSMHSDDLMVKQALRHGARGYLLKSSVTEDSGGSAEDRNRGAPGSETAKKKTSF